MKNIIRFQDWNYECGEPSCCSDYGTRLIINGNTIFEYTNVGADELKDILDALGVVYEIEESE